MTKSRPVLANRLSKTVEASPAIKAWGASKEPLTLFVAMDPIDQSQIIRHGAYDYLAELDYAFDVRKPWVPVCRSQPS
jgi:hypothetical protein